MLTDVLPSHRQCVSENLRAEGVNRCGLTSHCKPQHAECADAHSFVTISVELADHNRGTAMDLHEDALLQGIALPARVAFAASLCASSRR